MALVRGYMEYGTDAGEVVDLERRDAPVLHHADAAAHPVIARVDVGDEALDAVGHELDRAPE